MSLRAIVRACGGDLYNGGRRANIPAPGHSRHDRSVSLWLQDDRVFVNSFGGADWREVLDDLRRRGLIDRSNSPTGGEGAPARTIQPEPSDRDRIAAARRLWEEARPLPRTLSERHIRLRRVERSLPGPHALRHHPAVPLAVYRQGSATKPALLAAILDPAGALTAIEITYLEPNGRRADRLRLPRKSIGVIRPSSAVRLDLLGPRLLVGEGLFSTLSASGDLDLPGWALLSTRNLRTWAAPAGVESVVIAADRGRDGERSARILCGRLVDAGVPSIIAWPPQPHGDWNEAAQASKPKGEGEGGFGRARRAG